MRLWQRPPEEHCGRCTCAKYVITAARIQELTNALLEGARASGDETVGVVQRTGGATACWEEVRRLQAELPSLQKHVRWKEEQRAYLKARETSLQEFEVLLQLDYGGLQDSQGDKVSVWSATALAAGREQENFDFFFDAANQHQKAGMEGAKKNGQTGIFFLGELVDPNRSPLLDGI